MPDEPEMTKEAQAAYDEAIHQIEKFRRQGARRTTLDLSCMGLTRLPPEIGRLDGLVSLDLGWNKLPGLPAEIGQMKELKRLYLGNNQIVRLPEEMEGLAALEILDLEKNPLKGIPPWIDQLSSLTELSLDRIGLTHLPDEVIQLPQLRILDLSLNMLKSLPSRVSGLERLQVLYLDGNLLESLPHDIGRLTKLKYLSVEDNLLNSLPPALRNLATLSELYLHGNPGLGLPPEILGPRAQLSLSENFHPTNPKTILDYYFETRGSLGKALREVKLVLVGRGEVGKSTMAEVLQGRPLVKDRARTDGIAIMPWEVAVPDGRATLQVWDFGGQEIMHGTHQFFLTHRSLYIVMVDGRHDRARQDAEYWLKLVRAHGGDSRVLVVMNRQQAHPFDLDRQPLAEKYSVSLDHFFRTDCADPATLEPLKRAILAEAAAMLAQEELFPRRCWELKERLAAMKAKGENYLSDTQYSALCADHGMKEPEAQQKLLRRLADLGTVVSFPDDLRLAELSVLNPEWATDGIYRLITNNELRATGHGVLRLNDVRALLPADRWPAAKHLRYVFDLMAKFDLCFPVHVPGDGEAVLVPELLPDQTPAFPDWQAAHCLVFEYHYPVLPHGVLPRFITRTHTFSEGRERWRTGVVLGDGDGAEALVKADYEAGRVSIWVRGSHADARRGLLKVVRHEFAAIHAKIKDLNPQEHVAVPGHPAALVPYQDLLDDERRGKETFPVTILKDGRKQRIDWPVAELLNGVASPEERRAADDRRLPGGMAFSAREIQFNYHQGDNKTGGTSIEGSNYGIVGDHNTQTIINSFNTISGVHGDEVRKLFEELKAQTDKAKDEMKVKDAKVLDSHLAEITEEAEKPRPDRAMLEISGEGLIEAAKTVGEMSGPVITAIKAVLRFFDVLLP